MSDLVVRPVSSRVDRKAFVELVYELNRDDPNWVPPLKTEVYGLIDPGENPWFGHAEAQLFLARRKGRAVGRISAQVDRLVLEHMGEGTGQWGMIEVADEETAQALIDAAEDDVATGGPDLARGILPVVVPVTAQGATESSDEEVTAAVTAVLEARR